MTASETILLYKQLRDSLFNQILQGTYTEGAQLPTERQLSIREGRRVGALCIGVASNEVQRYGLNLEKRKRLIQAGADIIVPDFSQMGELLKVLF